MASELRDGGPASNFVLLAYDGRNIRLWDLKDSIEKAFRGVKFDGHIEQALSPQSETP